MIVQSFVRTANEHNVDLHIVPVQNQQGSQSRIADFAPATQSFAKVTAARAPAISADRSLFAVNVHRRNFVKFGCVAFDMRAEKLTYNKHIQTRSSQYFLS